MKELNKQLKQRLWLLVAGTATIIIAVVYAIAQQATRLAVNDLPLATAQTLRHELDQNESPQQIIPPVSTNLSSDSTVFAIITDNKQNILASSARLNDQQPLPPAGVFAYTVQHSSDRFTWQPDSGVRLATQVLTYGDGQKGGFIITGQSLVQAENRITIYGYLALAGIAATLLWTSVILYWDIPRKAKRK